MSDAPLQEPIATYLEWIRRSKNPNERREAALQLGERGYADALPDLIRLYQKDKNKQVREAAAYALGQFRAVEIKLQTVERDDVYELLEQVDAGELGSRANTGAWIRRIIALVVTLIILLIAFAVLPERVPTVSLGPIQIASSLSEDDAPIIADLREGYIKLRDNTNNLQTELDSLIEGGSLSCQAFFNELFSYDLSNAAASAYPVLPPIVTDYNTGVQIFQNAFNRYDNACFGAEPMTSDTANAMKLGLLPLMESLTRMESGLAAAEAQNQPTPIPPTDIPPVVVPTDAPAPTDEPPTTEGVIEPTADGVPTEESRDPTVEGGISEPILEPTAEPTSAEPTIEPTLTPAEGVFRHVNALYNIIAEVSAPRGAASLLVQYWQDVVDTGSTTGCNVPLPTIPADYVVTPESDLETMQELRSAVELVNVGLETLRGGWITFRGACNTGGLSSQAQSQLIAARVTLNSFSVAEDSLDAIIARSR